MNETCETCRYWRPGLRGNQPLGTHYYGHCLGLPAKESPETSSGRPACSLYQATQPVVEIHADPVRALDVGIQGIRRGDTFKCVRVQGTKDEILAECQRLINKALEAKS